MVFPIQATLPSYFVYVISATRLFNVFYDDETGRGVDLIIPNQSGGGRTLQAFTGNYYIRNYYGTLISSGALSAATRVPIPDSLPLGGYRIYLTQSVNDATYGFAGGAGNFLILHQDAHFPTLKGVPINTPTFGAWPDNNLMHAITGQGPTRGVDDDPTNVGYTNNVNAGASVDASWYANPANADPARPRDQFVLSTNAFPSTSDSAWQAQVAGWYDTYGIKWYEGPSNEPGGINAATCASQLQHLSQITKAARPGAKIMGPCLVSFNHTLNPPTGAGFLHNILANLAAMNPVPIDGISTHEYNCVGGDLSLGHLTFGNFVTAITQAGLQNLPRWVTEMGYVCMEHGVFMPRWQGRLTMMMYLMEEQYGIPKEHHALFKDRDDGWANGYGVEFNYSDGQDTWFPALGQIRAYSAELWGKTFSTAYDFGTPGNDLMQGSLYTGTDGTGLIALMSGGATDLTVTLTVTGASTLTQVDCFGNTSTLTVTGGKTTVALPIEPVYVRLPAGVTATPVMEWNVTTLGSDLARSSTPSTSGSAGNASATAGIMTGGYVPSSYYYDQQVTARGDLGAPYIDDTNAYPAWARFDWATAQTLDRVVVFAGGPPFQAQGTLLDFDVQWLDADAVTWHTATTITEKAKYGAVSDATANIISHVTPAQQGGCTVESYFSERWIFPVKFGSKVTTKAVRLYIRNATYGMDPTIEAHNAKSAADSTTFGNNFTIRQVQAFNSNVATPPPASNPFVVRNIA